MRLSLLLSALVLVPLALPPASAGYATDYDHVCADGWSPCLGIQVDVWASCWQGVCTAEVWTWAWGTSGSPGFVRWTGDHDHAGHCTLRYDAFGGQWWCGGDSYSTFQVAPGEEVCHAAEAALVDATLGYLRVAASACAVAS